jgi:hypothetical protein
MNKYKNKILVLLLIALSYTVNAQVYVGAGAGLYSLDNNYGINTLTDFNLIFKAGYIKKINDNFGVGLGLEYTQLKNSIKTSDGFSTSTNLVDDVTSAFVYKVTTDGYTEEQELKAIQIPLFLEYKKRFDDISSFYVRVGVKYLMPSEFNTKGTASKVTATGYYPDFNLLIADLPSRGFGTTLNYSEAGEYETVNIFMFSLEAGMSFDVGNNSLYTGFFLDRGTKSIIESKNDVSFIGYNTTTTTGRKLNGLYNSRLDGEVIPINIGVNLTYSFGK